MSVSQITKKDWVDQVLTSDTPVMVKFGAPWCGPCKSMQPILESISEQRTDIKIVDVDIEDEENAGLAQSFNVRGVPTMIIFDGGKEVNRKVGGCTQTTINEFIDQ